MLGALEWARVRTLAADGLSQREIARRLGIKGQLLLSSSRRWRASSSASPSQTLEGLDRVK